MVIRSLQFFNEKNTTFYTLDALTSEILDPLKVLLEQTEVFDYRKYWAYFELTNIFLPDHFAASPISQNFSSRFQFGRTSNFTKEEEENQVNFEKLRSIKE